MGSDRARVSYDEQRQYRAVIMQQGRVTVEADWNEEWQIVNEEIRKDVLDIVGPCGTPDDGYRVVAAEHFSSPPYPHDFSVTKGTMYVGGLRAYLPQDVLYSEQSDWIDNSPFIDSSPVGQPEREFIYLSLREQEVSAVEDSVLREVALGGPDTAQRLRLVQRIMRLNTHAQDCDTALAEAIRHWASIGYTFISHDDKSHAMRLLPSGSLQVGFQNLVTTPSLCEPQATGGYLGADNQLIRVQISHVDAAHNNYSLLWGYDNASFLYRVTAINDTTLKLASSPIDDFHKPRQGQAVEILRSAAKLDTGPQDTTDCMASATGLVTTLVANYDTDSGQVSLQNALPLELTNTTETPVLFLRVWEEVRPFTLGMPVVLGTSNSNNATGLQVTIQVDQGETLGVGTYWLIAVRPETPTEVYPHRYLESPQPPNGPRIWVCPLAVIEWVYGHLEILADCRNHFDNLVDLTGRGRGCCDETVSAPDIKAQSTSRHNDLQSIIDRHAHRRDQQSVTICLKPGTYELSHPLVIGLQHSNLVLEGCGKPVIIQCAPGSENNFLDGLVILNQTNNITLKGITFVPPATQFFQGQHSTIAGLTITDLQQFAKVQIARALQELFVSIGIRVLSSKQLTIKNCFFQFPFAAGSSVFGAGILANGNCQGFIVQENKFTVKTFFTAQGMVLQKNNVDFINKIQEQYHVQIDEQLLEDYEQKVIDEIVSIEQDPSEKQVTSTTDVASASQIVPKEFLAFTFGNNIFGCLFAPTTILEENKAIQAVLEVGTIQGNLARLLGASEVIAKNEGLVLTTSLQDALFRANHFTGLAAAAMIDASIGPITIEDNVVQQCSAGFYLLSSRTLASAPFIDIIGAAKESKQALALVPRIKNTLQSPLIQFGSVLARGYPLPQIFDKSQATLFTSANFPSLNNERDVINAWLDSFITLFTQNLPPPPPTVPLLGLNTLHTLLSITESLVLSQTQAAGQSNIQLSLQISGNTVDLVNRAGQSTSGTALLIWDDILSATGSITIGTNTLRNLSGEPTAFLLMPVFCTITGNLFLNSPVNVTPPPPAGNVTVRGDSLVLIPRIIIPPGIFPAAPPVFTGVAVTGNVFRGTPCLPARTPSTAFANVPSPMNIWEFLNTVMPAI